ncbi:olfactomedin-4-like [Tachysurus fulvidraco]|uniref:olfactomedin-4-like n=1 Tax=Tachysurus fulvidraco TaxID=1234273 RepID=UPI001FEE8E56|nr:olfactomedin-4-like [Tachysurus fulvidraco]
MTSSASSVVTAAIFLFLSYQSVSGKDCACELKTLQRPFPMKQLDSVRTVAERCSRSITSTQITEADVQMQGVQRRLQQLEESVSVLENEDDGDLYSAVSLRMIELEFAEFQVVLGKLKNSIKSHKQLSESTTTKLRNMTESLQELEDFDLLHVVRNQREIRRLTRELAECQHELQPPTAQPHCPQGQLVKVNGPRTYSLTQYGTSYPYGAWGKDPKPAPGKEAMYWLVALTSSKAYANYVRHYSSLSAILVGVGPMDSVISSSNPTTNTIIGPNVVQYGDALYYGCYNTPSVCRFNISSKSVTNTPLPQNSGFNNKFPFGHLDATYIYTDLDFSTDESGVWVVYTAPENFGNVILSEVIEGSPPSLGRTWRTSLHKRTATNTFMACGVLYATRFLDKQTEEIFYSFDTETKEERYDLKIHLKKMQTNIQSLHYNPRERTLYAYSDAYIVSYDAVLCSCDK